MKTTASILILLITTVFICDAANIQIIMDFESVTSANSKHITQGDFEINMGGPYGFMSIFPPSSSPTHPHPQNGTKYIQMSTQNMYPAIITEKSGSPFDIMSIDIGEYSSVFRGEPRTSTFKGYSTSGEILTQVFTVDGFFDGVGGLNDFETFNFGSEWKDLTRVEFINGLTFDNIAISIPEPSIAGLMGFTGCGIFFVRRFFINA